MSKDESSKTSDKFKGTRVDLGEDLLKTRELSPEAPHPFPDFEIDEFGKVPSSPEQIADQMESARILFGEGLLEEAKKVLRKILIADPRYIAAREFLEEIHEGELKQIFSNSPARRSFSTKKALDPALAEADRQDLLRKLEEDVGVGDFLKPRRSQLSLFDDEKALAEFGQRLERDLGELSARDRLDLGIGFLEMGFHELALKQFHTASHDPEISFPLLLAAKSLAARTLIFSKRPYEATLLLQPVIEDSETEGLDKLEFLFLMGLAQQTLGQPELATYWYKRVVEIDPRYRDVEDRLRGKS